MPIKPQPFKYVCSKCGYSKVVQLSGDCLNHEDMIALNSTCPKCKETMDKEKLTFWDKLFNKGVL